MESQEVIDFVRKKLRDKMGENGSNGSTENGGQRVISDICTEVCYHPLHNGQHLSIRDTIDEYLEYMYSLVGVVHSGCGT